MMIFAKQLILGVIFISFHVSVTENSRIVGRESKRQEPEGSETLVPESLWSSLGFYQRSRHLENLTLSESSKQCVQDFLRVGTSLNERWAQKMIDSYGKPMSGILAGNLHWFGDFYECQTVLAPAIKGSDSFKGQYCSLTVKIQISENISLPQTLTIGICVPNSCDETSLSTLGSFDLSMERILAANFNFTPNITIQTQCQPESQPFDNAAIATICVMSVFAILVVIGTSITLLEWIPSLSDDIMDPINYVSLNDSKPEKSLSITKTSQNSFVKDFFKCFCIYTNCAKILSMEVRKDLRCVHGIRFFSMTWVILGHTYAFAFLRLGGNANQILNMINNVSAQAIIQGTFSVDSFFLLSGFLLSYLFMKEATLREGKISWIFFYVHRYVRLTPVYALVIAFNTALTIHLGSGPNWPMGVNDHMCRKNWWRNLIYINNFDDESEQCLAWSWYLSNDTQFYVISPLFLYPLWRWPKVGLSIIFAAILGSLTATGIISAQYDIIPGYTTLSQTTDPVLYLKQTTDYFNIIYTKPYTRIGPYLIGIVLGYLIFRRDENSRPLHKIVVYSGWGFATIAALGVVYGFFDFDPSTNISAAYNSLSRPLFAMSLAWLIYACLAGHGGPVNAILSWKGLIPLSRLTYCAYLVHPIVILTFISSLNSFLQITHMVLVILFMGYLVISYAIALVCSASFESPLMSVEKLVLKRFQNNSNSQ